MKNNILIGSLLPLFLILSTASHAARLDSPQIESSRVNWIAESEDGIISVYKLEASRQGAKLMGSGIYNAITDVEFDLVQGKTYVLIAIIEGSSPFSIDLFSYSERDFLKPTHHWDDNAYKVESYRDYAMKSTIVKDNNNYSTLQLNLGLTTKSRTRRIRLSPNKEKGKPLHWVFYQLK